jgi:predicted SAM-dependent methyltransferase
MRLEIGSGKKPRTGFLTCDIRNLPEVDYVCSADALPFQMGEVDEIYSRHLIEHFTLKEFLKVLHEWNRVLKKEGEIYIICPNLLWHLQQILHGEHRSFYNKKTEENQRYWGLGSLFGWQQDEFDVHKFGYYFELIKDILEESGFDRIEDLTASGKGLENEPWHLEVRARKKHNAPDYKKSKFYGHFNVSH